MKTNLKPRDHDVFEILEELEKISARANKIEWLRTNFRDHKPLEYMIRLNYDKNIVSKVPTGAPPYNKEEQDGPSRSNLWQYLQVFPAFVVSTQSQKMKIMQIERMFIEMLDSLANKEAELVILAKDRQLESVYNIDLDLFESAFKYGITPATMPQIKERTPEEIAEELLDEAKRYKEDAKRLNTEARELEKKAKALMKEAEDNASEAS